MPSSSPPDFKNQCLYKRLYNALLGIRYCWQQESSFRTHVVLAIVAIATFTVLQVSLLWWALVALCIGLILAAEILNSAMEALIDHLHPEIHPSIGKIKDMMAGMVFILSAMTLVIATLAVADTLYYNQ